MLDVSGSVSMLSIDEKVPFGKQFRLKYFDFDPEYVPLNHGSFGASPTVVADRRDAELRELRRNPDKYLRYTIEDRLNNNLDKIAPLLGITDPKTAKNVVFINNATMGVNTVLRSYPFKKGDFIIYANTTYYACARTAEFLVTLMGIKTKSVDIRYPVKADDIVKLYGKAIDEAFAEAKASGNESPTVMAFFDTVSSLPGCKLPWKKLVALCKEKKALSFVDAAHGIGLFRDLDLETVRPDFLTTNLHKWLFVPSCAAVLYVDAKFHNVIQTIPISHSYLPPKTAAQLHGKIKEDLLRDKFMFVGTADYTSYISTETAIDFRKSVCGGEEAIQQYIFKLAKQAAELFSTDLETEIITSGLENEEEDIQTAMVNVYLPTPSGPLDVSSPFSGVTSKTPTLDLEFVGDELESSILRKYNVYFPINVYNGKLYTRLSAQVYVDLDDFKYGLKSFKQAFADFEKKFGTK